MRLRVTVTEAREITERDQHGDTENTEFEVVSSVTPVSPCLSFPVCSVPSVSEGWR
jgi:hypothetical protein